MSLDYIRSYYGVPAVIGAAVRFTDNGITQTGPITGAREQYLLVDFGGKRPAILHPTWHVEYLSRRLDGATGPWPCDGRSTTEPCPGGSDPAVARQARWSFNGQLLCGTCHAAALTPVTV